MENTHTATITIPTFQFKEMKTNQKSQIVHHENTVSINNFRRKKAHHRRRLNWSKGTKDNKNIRAVHQKKKVRVISGGGSGDDDVDQNNNNNNKEELESKIMALQSIVPGGETLGADNLFKVTADYILALQCQIKALKVLTNFIEGMGNEKRKFGA